MAHPHKRRPQNLIIILKYPVSRDCTPGDFQGKNGSDGRERKVHAKGKGEGNSFLALTKACAQVLSQHLGLAVEEDLLLWLPTFATTAAASKLILVLPSFAIHISRGVRIKPCPLKDTLAPLETVHRGGFLERSLRGFPGVSAQKLRLVYA